MNNQDGMTKDEVMDLMRQQSEFAIDLDNLPKQTHNWVDRGLKMSCEGAGHPHHSHFKTRSREINTLATHSEKALGDVRKEASKRGKKR